MELLHLDSDVEGYSNYVSHYLRGNDGASPATRGSHHVATLPSTDTYKPNPIEARYLFADLF